MNISTNSRTITLLIVCIILLAMSAGCSSEHIMRLCISYSSYRVIINTSEPITNATFYLPLPVKDGIPMTGTIHLDKSQFEKNNFSIDFVQSIPGVNFNGTYPVPNNQPWFLKISADKIDPDPSGSAGYSVEISNRTDLFTPVIFANTLYPVGNESVFLPKLDFSPPLREMISSQSPEWIEYSPIHVPQKTLIYADYSARPTARVEIFSDILVRNGWVEPPTPGIVYTGIDGGGNYYTDSYYWTHYGESHGWQVVNGELSAPNGVYPNLDHPIWQKMMHQT
jgi:hypothetical protein